MAVWIVLVLASAGSAPEATVTRPPPSISLIERYYYEGRYGEMLPLIHELRATELSPEQRFLVTRYHAFVLYLLALPNEATQVWRELLALQPDYRLSTDDVSPELVAFFNGLATSPAAPESLPPATPVEGSGPTPESTSTAESAPPTPKSSPAAPEPATDLTEVPVNDPRPCGIALCLVPLGVGQFVNGHPIKGVIFAALQLAALGLNLGMYWDRHAELVQNNGVFRDPAAAATKLAAQRVAFVSVFVFVAAGIGDAFLFP